MIGALFMHLTLPGIDRSLAIPRHAHRLDSTGMDHAMISIGPYQLPNRVILAPMAGVTDLPFRQLCRRLGAGLVVSEMVTSDTRLWSSRKSRQRLITPAKLNPVRYRSLVAIRR